MRDVSWSRTVSLSEELSPNRVFQLVHVPLQQRMDLVCGQSGTKPWRLQPLTLRAVRMGNKRDYTSSSIGNRPGYE